MPMKPEHLIACVEANNLRKPTVRRSSLRDWIAEWIGGDDLGDVAMALARQDGGGILKHAVHYIEIGMTDADLDYAPEPYVAVMLTGPLPADAWAEVDRRATEGAAA